MIRRLDVRMPQRAGSIMSSPASRLAVATLLLGLLLLLLGARLWLIHQFGSEVPINDQWEAEGANLLKPWADGTLRIGDLFGAHNEHRLVWSRLWTLALFELNGQWDPFLEIVANALLFCGIGVAFAVSLSRIFGGANRSSILAGVALWGALPFAQENTLWGFQSSFYFLIFFSIAAIWALLRSDHNWIVLAGGAGAALCACFTMASGFLCVVAAFLVACLRVVTKRNGLWQFIAVACVAGPIVLVGLLTRVIVPHHGGFIAHSAADWLALFGRCLAWPFCGWPAMALVIYLPLLLLLVVYVRTGNSSPDLNAIFQSELLIAIGLWVVLQAAAIAYGRGGHDTQVASRYMDVLALGALVNFFALLRLIVWRSRSGVRGIGTGFIGIGWTSLVLLGACFLGLAQVRSQVQRQEWLQNAGMLMRAYLSTHDSSVLHGGSEQVIPYPDPNRIARLLDDPTIQKILPTIIRPPLRLELAKTPSVFVTDGLPPDVANPSRERVWGSYSAAGAQATGTMESKPIVARFGYLQFEIASFLPSGLSLNVQDTAGKARRVIPTSRLDQYWRVAYRAVSHGPCVVLADDQNTDAWFAFREPRERGCPSYYALRLAGAGRQILICGAVLWSCVVVWNAIGFWRGITKSLPSN